MQTINQPEGQPGSDGTGSDGTGAGESAGAVAPDHAVSLAAILTELERLTQPSPVPANAWRIIKPTRSVRRFRGSSADLIAKLTAALRPEALVAARLAVLDDQGQLTPAPLLPATSPEFVFLRRGKDQSPYDALTATGSLDSPRPPLLDALHDHYTRSACEKWTNILFVGFDFASLAVLRSIGMPVTTSAGLERLTASQLEKLRKLPAPNRAVIIETLGVVSRTTIILPAWDIAGLSSTPPMGLHPVTQFLASVVDKFDVDLDHVEVWRPRSDEIAKIRLALQLEAPQMVNKEIQDSLEHSLLSLGAYERVRRAHAPDDYAAARRNLAAEIQREFPAGSHMELAARLTAINVAYERQVVDACIGAAMDATDGVRKALLLEAAVLTQQLHRSDPLVQAAEARVAGESFSIGAMRAEEIDARRKVMDAIVAIRREMRRN